MLRVLEILFIYSNFIFLQQKLSDFNDEGKYNKGSMKCQLAYVIFLLYFIAFNWKTDIEIKNLTSVLFFKQKIQGTSLE